MDSDGDYSIDDIWAEVYIRDHQMAVAGALDGDGGDLPESTAESTVFVAAAAANLCFTGGSGEAAEVRLGEAEEGGEVGLHVEPPTIGEAGMHVEPPRTEALLGEEGDIGAGNAFDVACAVAQQAMSDLGEIPIRQKQMNGG